MLIIFLFLATHFSLSISISKNIYVKYNDSNIPSCENEKIYECGDKENPFSSIMQMFYFIDLSSEHLGIEYEELNIFFLSKNYIIDSFNVSYYLEKLNQTNFPIWQVFKNISGLQINMRPYDLNKTVLIAIRTLLFSFQINNYTLSLQNINFDANDITFRLISKPSCLYWEIGCCILTPGVCTLILSKSSGYMTHIFELFDEDGILVISYCKFSNMILKRCLIKDGIRYCSNGFMLIDSPFANVKIENSYFEKINYISFFIGANINIQGIIYISERNFIWTNNTLILVNSAPYSSDNSTFCLNGMGQVSFLNSFFDSIFDFLKMTTTFDIRLENNIFLDQTLKPSSQTYNFLSITSYIIILNNNSINDINVYGNLIHLESAVLSIFNLSMSNIIYLWESSQIKIFSKKMNLKNMKILLSPATVEYPYSITIQSEVLISENLKIINQNKKIPINMIFQNINKIFISNFQLTEGSFLNLSNIIISFFNCKQVIASKLFFLGVSILISGESKYILISNSHFSLEGEDSTYLFQLEQAIYIQFKNVFFENFLSRIKGSLICLDTNNTVIIQKCYFLKITNLQSGGLIYAYSQNKIKIIESIIFNVKSFDNGGSLLIINTNYVLVFNSKIINSQTLNSGGFLMAYQSENLILARNTSFLHGVAADGAVFFINYNSTITLEDVFLNNNTAAYNGGTIKLNFYATCLLLNVKILDSSSLETGGAISMLNFNSLILKSSLIENVTSESGGVFSFKRYNFISAFDLIVKNVRTTFNAVIIKCDSLNKILFINITISNLTTEIGLFILESSNNFFLIESKISGIHSSKELVSSNIQNLLFFKNSSFINDNQNIFENFFFLKGNLNLLIFQSSYLNLMFKSFIFTIEENKFYLENFLLKVILSSDYFINLQTSGNMLLIIKKLSFLFVKSRIYSANTNMKSFLFLNVRNSLIFIANFSMNNNLGNLIELGNFYNCKLIIKNADILNFNNHPNLKYFKATYCWILIEKFYAINVNFFFNSSYLYINNSMFSLRNRNEKGILIHFFIEKCHPYTRYLQLKISNSIFVSNKVKSILVLDSVFCDNFIIIKNSFFRNNFAPNGPAINTLNLKHLNLENNYFILNRAKYNLSSSKGGVFYFETQYDFKYFTFINNTFIQNSADIGGVFYLNQGFPYIDETTFRKDNKEIENNTAIYYGQDFATNPIKFALDDKRIIISNLVSGKNYMKCLAFILISDFYNNYAYKSNDVINSIVIKNEMNEIISNNSDNWPLEDGFLCFKGYFKNKGLSFENIYWYNLKFVSNINTEVLMLYSFRPCKNGERLTNDYICVECSRNFYSFKFYKNEISTCSICSLNLPFFCFGGNNITIKYSFWRKSVESANILKCPNADACVGDTRFFDDLTQYDPNLALSKCAKGYTGPLCAICDINFGFSDKFVCVDCTDKLGYVKIIFFFLIQLFFSLFTTYKSLCTVIRIHKNPSLAVDTSSTNLLKIFSNHAAIIIIIFSLNETPLIFNSIFEGNPFNFNLSDKFTLDCLFKLLNVEVPFIYFKLLITIISPILILIISILFFQVYSFKRNKLKQKKTHRLFEGLFLSDIFQPLVLIIVSLSIPHLIRDCLSMFVYQNIGEEEIPDIRLTSDYSIVYNSESHTSLRLFLALPILIVSSFVFPIFLLFKLWIKKRSQSLYEQKNLLNFAFFFYSYQDKAFYWDIFTFFRRLFIQIVVMFSSNISFNNGKYLILLIILSFHLVTIFLLLKISPYKNEYKTIHSIEESSLLILIASTFFFLTLIMFETEDGHEFSIYFKEGLSVVIIIINMAFYLINFGIYVKSKKYLYQYAKELFGIFKTYNLLKKKSPQKPNLDRIKLKKISSEKNIESTSTTFDVDLPKYLWAKNKKNKKLMRKIKGLKQRILELNLLGNKNEDMRFNFQNLCFSGHFYKTIFKNEVLKIKVKYYCEMEKSIIYKFKLYFFSKEMKLSQIKTQIQNNIDKHGIFNFFILFKI